MQKTGQVRIIAGALRGSKLPVPALDGLRPSSDRVRETLFNWLQHEIAGATVLDLFAGSGALGFEAASRGAAEVTLVERHPLAAESLRASRERLKAGTLNVVHADALAWLAVNQDRRFGLVFLDPPFAVDVWRSLWPLLLPVLGDRAWVYLECAPEREPDLPAGLDAVKHGRTRQSRFLLARWQNPAIG